MDKYPKSFNYVLGTQLGKEEFDFFDNPYITAQVYELDEKWTPK